MLFFLVYRSTAVVPQRSAYEALIYLQARDRNAKKEITGYLHRECQFYVQYLEGPENAIKDLMRTIDRDWRHKDVQELFHGHVSARRFPGWDMAFTDAETSSFRARQVVLGSEPDISKASTEKILEFMDETALSEKARLMAYTK